MSNTSTQNDERFKKIIGVIIAVVTVIVAVVAYLQSASGNLDDAANRDVKKYLLEAFGQRMSGFARTNYDYNSAYQAYYEYDQLALAAEVAGDNDAADRYRQLRDEQLSLSPLLQAPYFDPAAGGEPNLARYEADTYVVSTTVLQEYFVAASGVKDMWDNKSNTYIVHLTILAVALFLFGMATTISGKLPQWIFAITGVVVSVYAAGWAFMVYIQPVPDLRQCKLADGSGMIEMYATGVGNAYAGEHAAAVDNFDKALAVDCASDFATGYAARAESHYALGNRDQAIADYEAARAKGDTTTNTAGMLAWLYYEAGRYDDAIALNKTTLEATPNELWIQFQLALAHLAKGEVDAARAEYTKGMTIATDQVKAAVAAGEAPDSWLWWGLEDAALSLEDYSLTEGVSEANATTAAELMAELKSLAVALEYTNDAPGAKPAVTISEFTFAQPEFDENGNVIGYNVPDEFEYGTDEISVLFDYSGMQNGQDIVFKVYVNSEEDPSWRIIEDWELGADGSAEKSLSLAYSNTQVFAPGYYDVEIYVENHLMQRGTFFVGEP